MRTKELSIYIKMKNKNELKTLTQKDNKYIVNNSVYYVFLKKKKNKQKQGANVNNHLVTRRDS